MIDGVALAGETVAKLTQLMLGPPGSFVELTLHRGAQVIEVWLMRSPSNLTPLQVNQQREKQTMCKRKQRAGVTNERSTMSRMTENSYLESQSSFASIDDDVYRELGGEDSWDPEAMAAQPSMVMSEASFDPERMVTNQMSEKSFDPECMQDAHDLMSERSFDPEMLVQMSEKSFDPEMYDPDAQSLASQKSFDSEMIGFMSEKSFDPESENALRQMSLMSQKSFDPEMIDLQDLKSERSFDPECAEAAVNMSINSQKSFDPELLHFDQSGASMFSQGSFDAELHLANNNQDDQDDDSEGSDASFDPEQAAGKRAASISSENSFDPEAAADKGASISSEQTRQTNSANIQKRAMGGLRSMRAQELQCGGGARVRVQANSCGYLSK